LPEGSFVKAPKRKVGQQAEDGDGQMAAAGTHALASVKPADLAQHRVRSGQEAHFCCSLLNKLKLPF
jgi:hypothetical protein